MRLMYRSPLTKDSRTQDPGRSTPTPTPPRLPPCLSVYLRGERPLPAPASGEHRADRREGRERWCGYHDEVEGIALDHQAGLLNEEGVGPGADRAAEGGVARLFAPECAPILAESSERESGLRARREMRPQSSPSCAPILRSPRSRIGRTGGPRVVPQSNPQHPNLAESSEIRGTSHPHNCLALSRAGV